jgi:hypothetical protein
MRTSGAMSAAGGLMEGWIVMSDCASRMGAAPAEVEAVAGEGAAPGSPVVFAWRDAHNPLRENPSNNTLVNRCNILISQ